MRQRLKTPSNYCIDFSFKYCIVIDSKHCLIENRCTPYIKKKLKVYKWPKIPRSVDSCQCGHSKEISGKNRTFPEKKQTFPKKMSFYPPKSSDDLFLVIASDFSNFDHFSPKIFGLIFEKPKKNPRSFRKP